MTRPTPHPKSGVYRVRLAIPASLRETAARLYARRSEFIESLGTKSPAEAKRLAPAAVGRLQAMLDATRRTAETGEGPRVTDRDVHALAGEHYRAILADYGDNPGDPDKWDAALDAAGDQLEQVSEDPEAPRVLRLTLGELDEARQALRAAGWPVDPETVEKVAEARFLAGQQAIVELRRRAAGDWSPSKVAERFPSRPVAAPAATCTFDALLRGWGLDRGWSPDDKPINRNFYDRHRTIERLASFLGHRDASKVTKADATRWKADAQTRGLKAATVRNDVSEMSAVWKWGLAHDLPLPHGNPFAGILPPKAKRRPTVRSFTDDEATTILTAARTRTGLLRWLPWVCCLTGARLAEIVQSVREDVTTVDGFPVLRIHDDGEGRSLKNADSRRTVPLHPALLAEGFGDYVNALPPGSPLFPDVPPDATFGTRATNAGKRVSAWVRKKLGITDPAISPDHSWRHWFEDAARKAGVAQEIRSTLTGHSAKMDEGAFYGDGLGSMTTILAAAMARVRLPAGLQVTPEPTPVPAGRAKRTRKHARQEAPRRP